jgi:cyclomaltodextrinase / maltogenic alpha-amylase / neopullulanase
MSTTPFDEPPLWAQKAIWYQIFIERFSNGNVQNDPTLETTKGALIDDLPDSWSITEWGHDWYQQEDWARETGLDFYRTIQMRRYGGDLQGVMNKIPYLKKLGINAVYFNPINDAPSLHKYDARHYHHVDVTFGNDREGDLALIASEDKSNPQNWIWTNADKLFLELIKEFHNNGIKVIVDFSWNHTGTQFWAFQDVIKHGENSQYKNWFEIKSFVNPETGQPELDYEGWFGISSLPEIRKVKYTPKSFGHPYEGNMDADAKRHIFAVCKRWMDPNGDGDPSDGIDGMRLDVAEHIPMGFWRELRQHVRSINPDFYLVGENWWESWPDKLMDTRPWVGFGDVFDAVMHYHWYKPARQYFNQGEDKINLVELIEIYKDVYKDYEPHTAHSMMNLASSHDSERVWSSLYNSNKYKHRGKPAEDSSYRTTKPDSLAKAKLFVLLLHQFTFVGSPHIWNGDEMGMWGADDPDNRKPMIWPEMHFDPELPPFHGEVTIPKFDEEIFDFYASLCKLHSTYEVFQMGDISFEENLVKENILSYTRSIGKNKAIVLINAESNSKKLVDEKYLDSIVLFQHKATKLDGAIKLGPYSGMVLGVK